MAAHWQLVRWSSGEILCDIYSAFETKPSRVEVIDSCGYAVFMEWTDTPLCDLVKWEKTSEPCKGLLARFLKFEEHKILKVEELPAINLTTKVDGCVPGDWCATTPKLQISASEPLEGFRIVRILVRIGSKEYQCKGDSCEVTLIATGEQGRWMEYWAESNFGDESDHVRIKYRSVPSKNEISTYWLDILGDEWINYAPSGSVFWELFPPLENNVPDSLAQPFTQDYLMTNRRYVYLAGHLIQDNKVDASQCPGNGLAGFYLATVCGEKAAANEVIAWQNRYDDLIYSAAIRHGIPAKVLKGIIAQESQFWPVSEDPHELGLGRLTEDGLELLLTWNPEYYLYTCLPVLGDDLCSSGYTNLSAEEKLVLRGELISRVGTSLEPDMLAAVLEASALQTGQLVRNITQEDPVNVTTYMDMWMITIANYHAGSGCISEAINKSGDDNAGVSWVELSDRLPAECLLAKDYVDKVMYLSQ